MSGKGMWNNPEREARLRMEDAAKKNRNEIEFQHKLKENPGDEKFVQHYKLRGRLYDKIKVSLHTMDIIIWSIVVLLILALIVGAAIGK